MQKYTNQLLQKLNEAKAQVNAPIDPKIQFPSHPAMEYEGLEYIALWESGIETPALKLFDIESYEFPPMEKLTEEQAKDLYEAIVRLLEEINNFIQPPEKMPYLLKYQHTVELWKKGFMNLRGSNGSIYHDFCSGDSDSCILKEWCQCKDF